jgi:hypothetical protein
MKQNFVSLSGEILIIQQEIQSLEDVVIHLVYMKTRSTLSEVVLCLIEKDKFVNAPTKLLSMILFIKSIMFRKQKVWTYRQERIIKQQFSDNQWSFMEGSMKTDRLPMRCLIMTLSIMIGENWISNNKLNHSSRELVAQLILLEDKQI